jgi:hypothetical protein
MASATLEMILKLSGVDKTSRGLDKVSDSSKKLDSSVKNSEKTNAKFSAGMSGLGKTAIAGASIFAAKKLGDFALSSITAASAAQEAAGAFGTTFGDAAEDLGIELSKNANLFGLTTSEAKQLIGIFGAVAQGMGFTQDESADLSSNLFGLAGDIASFNNVTAGAEPVLRAFQSAIVGEREALKTYGIAISESEVQTKAFTMTGKSSADALTRQEKALATSELLFEKAAVQIGNAEREAGGFAAQMLTTRAATQELREEVGDQLLPAAGLILGAFNEFVEDVSPLVVGAFGLVGDAITTTAELTDKGRDAFTDFIARYILGQRVIDGSKDAIDEFNNTLEEENKILNENSVTLFNAAGTSQDLMHVVTGMRKAYSSFTRDIQENRSQVLINTTQFKKMGTVLEKELHPIFGESNALIMTNMQLERDRKLLLDLITSANDDVATATDNRNRAASRLNELQIDENIADAEAAIRKSELETRIGFLTDAQEKGKDVTLDLALAEAELAEAEFELINDSPQLISAREDLELAERNLETAVDNQKLAVEKRNEALIIGNDIIDKSIDKSNEFKDSLDKLNDVDFDSLFQSLLLPEDQLALVESRSRQAALSVQSQTPDIVSTPEPDVSTFRQESQPKIDVSVQIGEEAIEDIVVKTSKTAEERSAFFSRLIASGAE